jgi:hypothetical protein
VKDRGLGRELLPRVQTGLVSVIQNSPLSPRERSETGNTLSDIGDPRFREDVWWLPDETILGFVEISAGLFHMGEKGESIKIEIPYTYYISRYPVTQAQFQAFVEDGGYQEESFWLEAKAIGVWRAEKVQDRSRAESYGGFFEILNHPVVGVTWYEPGYRLNSSYH